MSLQDNDHLCLPSFLVLVSLSTNSSLVADTSDQSIKIIRRSARWKKGGRGKRSSTSTDSAQSGSASPDLSSSTSDLSKASPDLSKSSSVSPDPDCRIFCPSTGQYYPVLYHHSHHLHHQTWCLVLLLLQLPKTCLLQTLHRHAKRQATSEYI